MFCEERTIHHFDDGSAFCFAFLLPPSTTSCDSDTSFYPARIHASFGDLNGWAVGRHPVVSFYFILFCNEPCTVVTKSVESMCFGPGARVISNRLGGSYPVPVRHTAVSFTAPVDRTNLTKWAWRDISPALRICHFHAPAYLLLLTRFLLQFYTFYSHLFFGAIKSCSFFFIIII